MSDSAIQIPNSIKIAFRCLWANAVIPWCGLALIFFDDGQRQAMLKIYDKADNPVLVFWGFFFLIIFLIGAFLCCVIFDGVKDGKNWARIICLIFCIYSSAAFILHLKMPTSLFEVLGRLLSIACLTLQYYAIFLIFTPPGKEWFAKKTVTEQK
jgi:hypothetical protein